MTSTVSQASKANGYIFTLLAIVIFSIQDGISKHLGAIYPPVFVAMIRYWAFALFAIALAARTREGLKITATTRRPWLQILRGVLLPTQIVMVITSFTWVGLAHSQAILAATPLFVALLSMPLLGERVGWRRWLAISVGLGGVLLILKPADGLFDRTFLLPLGAALLFALYVIVTRLVSRQFGDDQFLLHRRRGRCRDQPGRPVLLGHARAGGLGLDAVALHHRILQPLLPHPGL